MDTYSVQFLVVPDMAAAAKLVTVEVQAESRSKAITQACKRTGYSRYMVVTAYAHNPMPGGGRPKGHY